MIFLGTRPALGRAYPQEREERSRAHAPRPEHEAALSVPGNPHVLELKKRGCSSSRLRLRIFLNKLADAASSPAGFSRTTNDRPAPRYGSGSRKVALSSVKIGPVPADPESQDNEHNQGGTDARAPAP